jgi:molybdopterin-guanine dinucleotide biosynthesis protein A
VVVQAPVDGGPVGFVVAGGLSTRMGRDKALLPWRGTTLLDHALARLDAVCADVRILCGPAARYEDRGRPLVRDEIPDAGPLAAIAAGLRAAGRAAGLFLAVDLPGVPIDLLRMLAMSDGEADADVPVIDEGPQPLCALYGPQCLRVIDARLAAGERKMTSFWPDLRVRTVGQEALSRFGDPAHIFRNVNAPSDYEAADGGAESR